ncbi:MAG TPA: MarR family transcriptional regulator [Anaerolineaceae bacterium]|jgi:MarR family 2-MHQ and catechol resistance regulon transcriptional repressor|nr:MarR family transcriptional regulator [Anaerolineaceae bacterium]
MPTHYSGTTEETLALNTYIKLTRAVNTVEARVAHQGAAGDLTPSQFGVLEALLHLGPLCPGELSVKLLKSTGNITLVLDNLEKRGLIQRERSAEDRRMIRVSLTDTGKALIARIFPDQVKAIAAAFSSLSVEEQHRLGDLCRKLGKAESGNPLP